MATNPACPGLHQCYVHSALWASTQQPKKQNPVCWLCWPRETRVSPRKLMRAFCSIPWETMSCLKIKNRVVTDSHHGRLEARYSPMHSSTQGQLFHKTFYDFTQMWPLFLGTLPLFLCMCLLSRTWALTFLGPFPCPQGFQPGSGPEKCKGI